jgi:hypothetical protein
LNQANHNQETQVENCGIDLEIWEEIARHPRLGEILIQMRKVSIAQLEKALQIQAEKNIPIGEILIDMGLITKNELVEVLELQFSIVNMLKQSFQELVQIADRQETEKALLQNNTNLNQSEKNERTSQTE